MKLEELKRRMDLLETATESVKAVTPQFGEDLGIKDDDVSELLTALCILSAERNRYFFAAKKMRSPTMRTELAPYLGRKLRWRGMVDRISDGRIDVPRPIPLIMLRNVLALDHDLSIAHLWTTAPRLTLLPDHHYRVQCGCRGVPARLSSGKMGRW